MKYKGVDVGSGLFILEYDLGNGYILHVGGTSPIVATDPEAIMYARLSHNEETIDIRTDDVGLFIASQVDDSTTLKGTKEMTLYDVRKLALIGDSLDWSHFADYKGRDIGSGQNVWEFELPKGFVLHVCGVSGQKPSLIELSRDGEKGIDIRTDDVSSYIATKEMTLDDVIELAKKGNDLDWSDFEDYKCYDTTTCIRYWTFDLGDGFELEVGGPEGEKPDFINLYYNSTQFCDVRTEDVSAFIDNITAKYIIVKGDANFDRHMDMADVVFIMQCLANPDKYQFTEQGRINADMDGNGVTVADARTIQMLLLGYDINEILGVDSSLIAKKQFVYDSDLGVYVISFSDNGSYFFDQGDFDAHRDTGTWKISGNTVVLTGQFGINRFRVAETVLTYIAEGSDGFGNVKPKDGEKFYVAYENSGKNELKASDIISIKTPYSPAMSDWSGIGILLEVDSPNCSISLRAADGHFTEWDIKTGSGPIKSVGKEYDIGKNGYIFWTPDELSYKDGFDTEIQVIGVSGDVYIDFGKIYVTQVKGGKFVASFEKTDIADSSVVAGKTFVYEKGGIGSDFEVTFGNDGRYSYYEGNLSSYIGSGTWEIKGDTVVMTEDVSKKVNNLKINGSDLVYNADGSDNFYYIKVKDGEKFYVKQSAATLLGIDKAKIKSVNVTSLPEGYDYSFTGDKAQAIYDYLSDIGLSSELSVEDPGQLNGMLWVIRLDYENGDSITLYDSGKFIHGSDRKWYEMPYEESQGLSELIWELGK